MKVSTTRRIDWIDYAKAIGIFLVVFGHTYLNQSPNPILRNAIYSFHMPLFFFISGCLHRQSSQADNLRRGFQSLIVPAVLWNVIWIFGRWMVDNFMGDNISFAEMHLRLVAMIKGSVVAFVYSDILPCDVSWFLVALFYCRFLFGLLMDRRYRVCAVLFYLLLCLACCRWNVAYVRAGILALPIYVIGHVLFVVRERIVVALRLHWFSAVLSGLVALMFVFTSPIWHGKTSWMVGKFGFPLPFYGHVVLSYVIALLGVFVVIGLAVSLVRLSCDMFMEIGQRTLVIMCSHQVVCHRLIDSIPQFEWWSALVRIPLSFAIVLGCMCFARRLPMFRFGSFLSGRRL